MRTPRSLWPATLLCGAFVSQPSLAADASQAAVASAAQAPVPAPVSHGDDGARAERDAEAARRGRTWRTLGWISLSIGAEAAVVASVTSVMLLYQQSVRDDECNAQKVCSRRGLDANGTIASLVPWNTASWIAMAAGLGAGVALLVTNRPETRLQATIAVVPNAAGVGVRGAF